MPGLIPPTGKGFDDPWLPIDGGRVLDAIPAEVFRIHDDGTLEPLPNVEAVQVFWPGGARPKTCQLAYRFDGVSPATDPQWAEEALSSAGELLRVVKPNDRIGVRLTQPGGDRFWVFDGEPYGFEMLLDDGVEEVVLACAGIEKRLWDAPVPGALIRNGDAPYDEKTPDGKPNHVPTDIPAVFNPGGKPNCTPTDTEYDPTGNNDRIYPVFLDPELVQDPDPRTLWTAPKGAAYLIYPNNPDEKYVTNPDSSTLDDVLIYRKPHDDYDPTDPATYDREDIVLPETPITGRPWPATLEALVADQGFGVAFRLDSPDNLGPPETKLDVFFRQAQTVRDLWLQDHDGQIVDCQLSNLGACHLTRDISEAVNRWEVRGARNRWEVSVVLACGFPSQSASGEAAYDLASLTADTRDAFRLYIFDECGEGHYQPGSATRQADVPSLDAVLGSPAADGTPRYAKHRRPALGDLLSSAPDGRPIRARLSYSTDYGGASPGLWDGTGTWHEIQGGYDLLPERLGIWVNVQNPNAWQIGNVDGHAQVLKGIDGQVQGIAPNLRFFLRLTCTIEADEGLAAIAERKDTAPISRDVSRAVDARQRYRVDRKAPGSEFAVGGSLDTVRDDTAAAQSEADALRDATDSGVLDGPVTIPWITMHYDEGDRIRKVNGRELYLRTDGGTLEPSAVLPSVQSIRWRLRQQETDLTISDAQAMRKTYHKRIAANTALRARGRRG